MLYWKGGEEGRKSMVVEIYDWACAVPVAVAVVIVFILKTRKAK